MLNSAIFTILKHYNNTASSNHEEFSKFCHDDWVDLYKTSTKQGVSAIAYNTISTLPKDIALPRDIKLRWALHSEAIEKRGQQQLLLANTLCDMLKAEGINTVVLKGIGLSIYYPQPLHRECGDFDCYLFEDYTKGLKIAIENGAIMDHEDYKHAQIRFKTLNVEIHKHLTSYRGERLKHEFENTLVEMLKNRECKPIGNNSNILIADPTFTACFVIYHTLFHFLFESVKIRHILDWLFLVKAESQNIDWDIVIKVCEKHKMLKFAEAMTAICKTYLGLEVSIPITDNSEYRDKILNDIMSDVDSVSKKKGWNRRIQLLKNTYKSRWKYKIIGSSFTEDIIKRMFYIIFSNDKLKTIQDNNNTIKR